MRTRIFPISSRRRPREASRPRALILLLLPVLFAALSGCSGYFFQAQRIPELLVYESFDYREDEWWRLQERWDVWSDSTFGDQAALLRGRLEVYGPLHFMRSKDEFDPDLTALAQWSVTNGNVTAFPTPLPLSDNSDFTLSFDELDIIVALELYRGGSDQLRVYRESGFVLGSASVPSEELTHGTLEFGFRIRGRRMEITAAVAELGLEINAGAAAPDRGATRVTFGASGLPEHPRALETVIIYRPVDDLGGEE